MGTTVLAVRIGDRYGREYEDYINSKLDNVVWINKAFDPRVQLQWNKLYGMSMDTDDPIVVLDIDQLLINDYMDLIEYPIERGEFVSINPWWQDSPDKKYKMQGGFQKYYPKDCKYIYDKFISNPEYWQQYYIKNGTTIGPCNGEQYFVEDSVNERLSMKFVPQEWIGCFVNEPSQDYIAQANVRYPGEWYYLGEFNPDVKLVHFMKQTGFSRMIDKEQ